MPSSVIQKALISFELSERLTNLSKQNLRIYYEIAENKVIFLFLKKRTKYTRNKTYKDNNRSVIIIEIKLVRYCLEQSRLSGNRHIAGDNYACREEQTHCRSQLRLQRGTDVLQEEITPAERNTCIAGGNYACREEQTHCRWQLRLQRGNSRSAEDNYVCREGTAAVQEAITPAEREQPQCRGN